ncbi:N-acylneuraminate cytidylyltransferase [Sedimentibacter hydroxybenzoicus DSM 7310]|uniref:N-acylneuraminate cytidylyltransferase n=1 Tax=Sedimentibacter hydroxybenzoicus DSM 7310 TaxID=1123245 RepID=A0A974GUT0_SEDHY|nr:N-acylneuraminate cytidylyltransferase [Sedimentibacter hydroxybenzoicus]NYB72638.1 N-acylneuraminate cytidylyltransferase [Sedimentibacter hydroxybenzoicus DSM 7310]
MLKNFIGKTVAFIPVRGGSKSIPLKNIKLINNRPLIYWTLDATVNCDEIDSVVVSTDSKEIKRTVEKYSSDKVKVIDRSEEVSTDTATTESVMIEFARNYDFENIVLVQATSPLLKSKDITKGINKYFENGIDSALSVVRQKRFIWEEKSSSAVAINYIPSKRPRRQEFDGFLVENGAFYITSKKNLLSSQCRISGNITAIEMSEDTYYEIDEPSDWAIVEELLKKNISNNTCDADIGRIKCFLTDSDGVLTDGGMYYSENGDELKKFNTKDGMGFKLLKEAGIITGIITGENIELVRRRAEKMKVDEVHLGVHNKMEILNDICSKYNLKYEEIAYIGDDINDLDVIRTVGLGCTVYDGMDCVKDAAKIITKAKGGEGAVREIVEIILNVKKR